MELTITFLLLVILVLMFANNTKKQTIKRLTAQIDELEVYERACTQEFEYYNNQILKNELEQAAMENNENLEC